ncbi:MAG: alpha/beta hydrolase [Alteromonadales bacterium]|nr:alpha/beta hydrolase [Alteromonadales bacterium]
MSTQQAVILLHGVAKTELCMRRLQARLTSQGYLVINQSYASLSMPIEQLADEAINEALTHCQGAQKIHFVTHSMGGILVRLYLQKQNIKQLGRVVMLGPPNKGSQIVDLLKKWLSTNMFNHQAVMQLSTECNSLPNMIGPANFDLGIIAGKGTVNPLLSLLLPGENDGKVSVESTKLVGMSDHLIMYVTHPFMMFNNKVLSQVSYFLSEGCFKREKA